jgi:N-acetyl-gamma-glutamyl-phosphate reductase
MAENDGMEITVAGNEERILLIARYDNLGKGASGAALECMNCKMGQKPEYMLNL